MKPGLVVSCEHGGNTVPAAYAYLFRGCEQLLQSHRGFDAGALELARELAARCRAPLRFSTVSRLLVDLNRSIGSRSLFSEITRKADRAEQSAIVERFYMPFRQKVLTALRDGLRRYQPVVHLSVHTFTPVLAGVERRADVGLLYDPRRRLERAFCRRWRSALRAEARGLTVRMNYPYRGRADGLTTYLRTLFAPEAYLGIELEVNQKFVLAEPDRWPSVKRAVVDSLTSVLADLPAWRNEETTA